MRNGEFTTFYAVWTAPRADDPRTLRPVRKTFNSKAKAMRAAEQMSAKHKGKKFFVLEAISRVETKGESVE